MLTTIVIDGEFCTLNEYVEAERANRYMAAGIKSRETLRAQWAARDRLACDLMLSGIDVTFTWYRKSRKSDPDNIAFAQKFILDGLQLAGVIAGDGWKHIRRIVHQFEVDKQNPRVVIELR